jgi:hypothetical protein
MQAGTDRGRKRGKQPRGGGVEEFEIVEKELKISECMHLLFSTVSYSAGSGHVIDSFMTRS